jgi:glycosyltransferase involved in cell wall biosynthesis
MDNQALPRRAYTILHTESSLGWGGQEHRILAEMKAMRARGHRLYLASDPVGQLYPRALSQGFQVVPLTFGGWSNLGALRGLRHFIRDKRVEVLNTHSSLDSWVGLLAWETLRPRPVLVRTRHLSTPVRTSWPTRRLYQTPAAVITTGEVTRELLISRVKVAPERIFSIPTGVSLQDFVPREADPALRAQLNIPLQAMVFGSVAVLRSWKGHLYLLEALGQLLREGAAAHLVLVGEGPYRVVIEEKLAALGLEDKVRLTGYQDDVAPYLALMDAVVLASYANEGVPQALLQAMAMERPVIGTEVGGIPEIIIPGETGLLVPPKDPSALARAMGRVLTEAALRRDLGRRARDLVVNKFSLEMMAAAVESVYDGAWER